MPKELATRFFPSFIEGRENHYLRFGTPARTERPSGGGTVSIFRPGARFGLVFWNKNQFGTQDWSVTILRACALGERIERVPQVRPGAEILLHAAGRGKVETGTLGPAQRMLATLDEIESAGTSLEDVSADFWRSAHYRVRHRGWPLVFDPASHIEAAA